MLTEFDEIYNIKVESAVLKEYIEVKKENYDFILLFQIGAFFETLFEDAKTFSEITGSALAKRTFKSKITIMESGVPKESVNFYIKKLLNKGLKVCVCQEFKDEYGGAYREITRKYTQGTILEDEFLDFSENNYIMALYFKDDAYNIAYSDVSTGQIYKTTANSKEYKVETEKVCPKEIIIPKNQEKIFKSLFSYYDVSILDEKYFENSIEDAIDKYCKHTQKKFKIKFDKIIEYKPTSYMALDSITRKNLEFTRTNYLSKKKGSILWFLNYTKTPMGIRLLKKFLNEPLLSKKDILDRQSAVEEFIQNPELLYEVQDILQKFGDLTRTCSRLSNATILPRDLVNLIDNSILLVDLKNAISNLNSNIFKINANKIDKLIKLANTINIAIKKDCPNELKSGGIINDGYSAQLDFLKNELDGLCNEIKKYETQQKKKTDIKELSINYSKQIGYYIEIPKALALKAPKEYFKKNSTNKLMRFSTQELTELEENISSGRHKINNLEFEIYKEVRIIAGRFVSTIRSLAKDIAYIDVISSFAKSAIENNFVKPEIIGEDIVIKNGYHPSLIKLNNEIIKNDTKLKKNSMIVLTGANMSGKSTYLKHNAIICILAQIGSYVPAESAKLPIIDKIFYRQSTPDDIINNNSSFMVEMNDLKYIIENTTDLSLILLDEPAKSTNSKESGAIARAFCEYILKNYKSKTMIATHNLELTKLEHIYPDKVINYTMGQYDNMGQINRKIIRGIADKSYAIDTAILAQLPNEILKLAKEYME